MSELTAFEIKAKHTPRRHCLNVEADFICDRCEVAWPCDAARLLTIIERWSDDLAARGYDGDRVMTATLELTKAEIEELIDCVATADSEGMGSDLTAVVWKKLREALSTFTSQ